MRWLTVATVICYVINAKTTRRPFIVSVPLILHICTYKVRVFNIQRKFFVHASYNNTEASQLPGASPHISGWGGGRISAVSFGSDQWKDMCFYGTDKYIRDLASFDLISPRQSKDCDET